MNLGIVTIHKANNYGAVLQAVSSRYAFSEYANVYIIDYRNPHIDSQLKLIRLSLSVRGVARAIKDVMRLKSRRNALMRFSEFIRKYGNLTSEITSNEDFKNLVSKFEIVVCGSDQIWNPWCVSSHGKLNNVYFLDVGDESVKRISYASSIGSHVYSEDEARKVKNLLGGFARLSCREYESSQYLSELTQKNVSHVLDPTLLLRSDQWLELSEPTQVPPNYIAVYQVGNSTPNGDLLKFLKNKLNLPIVQISQNLRTSAGVDVHINDAGPSQFLHILANSEYIVTDSFHGCCFSILFQKPFSVLAPEGKLNRITSLLKVLDLEERIVINPIADVSIGTSLNYERANHLLEKERTKSFRFIEEAINACI